MQQLTTPGKPRRDNYALCSIAGTANKKPTLDHAVGDLQNNMAE
jgi:hypothetical protein